MTMFTPIRQGSIEIRTLDSSAEFLAAEAIQAKIWQCSDRDLVPASVFAVARRFGGQVLGLFDQTALVGFALSFAAFEDRETHFHSHMVGILPQYQNRGLGRLIKLAQRQDALSRGIERLAWTFDPLLTRNAYFNLVRLGGRGTHYLPNFYGETSSPLHGSLPTDRLLVEWDLASPRVLRAIANEPDEPGADAQVVAIPSMAGNFAFENRIAAQTQLRERLLELLQDGLVVTGFKRLGESSSYYLERRSQVDGD